MRQQLLFEMIQVMGPMGDCGIYHQRAKIYQVGEIGSSRYPLREAFCAGLYNRKHT
jgi:hypothetical protein